MGSESTDERQLSPLCVRIQLLFSASSWTQWTWSFVNFRLDVLNTFVLKSESTMAMHPLSSDNNHTLPLGFVDMRAVENIFSLNPAIQLVPRNDSVSVWKLNAGRSQVRDRKSTR